MTLDWIASRLAATATETGIDIDLEYLAIVMRRLAAEPSFFFAKALQW